MVKLDTDSVKSTPLESVKKGMIYNCKCIVSALEVDGKKVWMQFLVEYRPNYTLLFYNYIYI